MGRFALGDDNGCAVKSDATLWCFGDNVYGQLGRGVIDGGSSMARPVLWQNVAQVETFPGVLDVFVGQWGACARRSDGRIYCWGKNDLGQVGDGTTVTRVYPVAVTGLGTSVAVEQGAAGASFRCVRRTDGTVWCWGGNVNGELGDGTTLTRPDPVALTTLGTMTAELDLGASHGCARRFDGSLWCWGANTNGQLGDGTTLSRSTPAAVTALGTALVTKISLGGAETCVRLADGTVSCWGKNTFGQIGDGSTSDRYSPVPVTALGTTVVELATGSSHTCARHGNGSLSCWGYGFYGQVGDGMKVDRWLPVAVTALGLAAAELASGGAHSCARRLDGSLWCWGNNWKGQLGNGTALSAPSPALTLSLRCHCGDGVCSRAETLASCPVDCRKESCGDKKCTGSETEATTCPGGRPSDCQRVTYGQLASGRWHNCALRPDGSLWCWGKNHNGQIGDGTTLSRFTPAKITALGTAVSSFALGANHSCARLTDGTVKCWGNNNYGEVGDNTTVRRLSPVAVTALGTATVSLGLGYEHSCAVMADKKLRCWGSNFWSTIGDGTATDRWLPVAVTTLGTQVAQVTGGHDHTCARLTTNALKCWGRSDVGQVGDGSTAVRTRPVAITALGSVVAAVAAGDYHTCATKNDGSLFCWGMNGCGEVGDGSTTVRKLPVAVAALGTTVAEVTTGANQSCARLKDFTVSCWGNNNNGQLGDGSTVNRWLPGPVATLSAVSAIASGEVHNCAKRSDGSLWCWGANFSGSLGAAAGGYAWTPFAQSRCGDGVCAYDEAAEGWCSADCATTCGDCVCDGVLETPANCAADCVAGNTCTPAVCGNGTCNAGEDCSLCPADCGTCY